MKRLTQLLAAIMALVFAALTCQPAIEPAPAEPSTPVPTPSAVADAGASTTAADDPPVPIARHVLVVGDSEACAVSVYAKPVAALAGDTVGIVCKESTTVQNWSAGRLKAALEAWPDADAIVVFLGTNHYLDAAAPPVRPILALISSRGLSCVWVGNTAVMGKARKINGLMRTAVTPTCAYFDTEAFGVELRDGVHPTPGAAKRWIQAVWSVIPAKNEPGVSHEK